MKHAVAAVCLFLFLFASLGEAHLDHPERSVAFDQYPGRSLPLDAVFVDDTGKRAPLRSWFVGEPVLLVLGYLRCANLCDTTLAQVNESLRLSGLAPGRDYRGLFVSIDPGDAPPAAASALAQIVPDGQRPGWHFLTASGSSARELAQAIGFRYEYDAESRQYAHPAGFIVVTPDGVIARYFPGVRFEPAALRAAVNGAAGGQIGTYAGQLLLLCYHLAPSGRYAGTILALLHFLVLGFLLAFVVAIFRLARRERPHP